MRTACPGMLGNFNLIVSTEHKNSGTVNRAMMGRFRRLISDLELKVLLLLVRKYTWSNHQGSPTLVKLDRMLCSADWEQLFPNYLLQSCATYNSEHDEDMTPSDTTIDYKVRSFQINLSLL